MKKRILICVLILNIAFTFAGCSGKNERQAQIRDEGIELMNQEDYEGAIKKFDDALLMSTGRVSDIEIDIDYYKAAAQFASGDLKNAKATYSALIEYDDSSFEPYYLRGCIYANEGQFDKALKDYNAALNLDKKNYELYIQIYENLRTLGHETEGMEYLKYALKMKDNSANGAYYKGRIYYMCDNFDKAEPLLKKAEKKNILDAKLYLAKVYQARGQKDEAQALLKEYAAADQVNSDALGTLGDIEMVNGNYEEALSYYQTGLSLEKITNYVQLYKGEIVAYEKLNKFEEASKEINKYLKMYPGDEAAQREKIFLESRY